LNFGRTAGEDSELEDSKDSGAARLPAVFVTNVGIGVTFVDSFPSSVAEVVEAAATRLIATTSESDCILCCGSTAIGLPVECVAVLVAQVVDDNGDKGVAILMAAILTLAVFDVLVFGTVVLLSTEEGSGVFGTYCGC